MIDAYGRGMIAGGQEARNANVDDVKATAKRIFADMRLAGYAHILPESEFIRGFVEGVRLFNFQRISR